MSLPSKEIPLGAMRFNSDSQKLEYFNGEIWMQVHTFSPNLGGNGGPAADPTGNSADQFSGVRGVFGGSYTYGNPSSGHYVKSNIIDYITISTVGNAIDFGDCTANHYTAGSASSTRMISGGGGTPYTNAIQYVEIMTTGNAADFGDLSTTRRHLESCSNGHGGL